jgi:hypothetical protein
VSIRLRRREFIAGFGGAAVGPRAQQGERLRGDPASLAEIAAMAQVRFVYTCATLRPRLPTKQALHNALRAISPSGTGDIEMCVDLVHS